MCLQVQVQPKYMTALNDVECILKFEEGMQMVDIKRSLEHMQSWLGMPVQSQCKPQDLRS